MSVLSRPHPLDSRPALRDLLTKLHALSLEQEKERYERGGHFPTTASTTDNQRFAEQLVALDEDKAQAIYLLLKAMGATRVVEAGTSYGVSLLWLLAAVTETVSSSSSRPSPHPPLVIGTENVPSKASIALEHVEQAFGAVPECLQLLQGDLLETLPAANLPDGSIDALLLDIWAPLALPTLKILVPKLRVGAAVFIDNSVASEGRYADLLNFVRAEGSGFQSVVLPFSSGLEMVVFQGTG
ncbi:hypothetical protein JCM10207_000614 [Rhodosporidiobolus poonsookiae]